MNDTRTITFEIDRMNAVQLARLYKLLIGLMRFTEAELVWIAGAAKCGPMDFCIEVARA